MSPRKVGSVVLVLALAHLFAPAAYALPPSGSLTPVGLEGFTPAAWEWLMFLVSPGEAGLLKILQKAGSSMDPNGYSQDSTGTISKAGSSMDPDGEN